MIPEGSDYVHLVWHVERDGETCRFRPEIGKSRERNVGRRANSQRPGGWMRAGCASARAWTVSPKWSRAVSLCRPSRRSTTRSVQRGPHSDRRSPRYPGACLLHWWVLRPEKQRRHAQGDPPRARRVHDRKQGEALLQKLAKLAAKEYAQRQPEMDAFFSAHRFVRISAIPPRSERLPLLEDAPLLRNLLLTMYAMKHLTRQRHSRRCPRQQHLHRRTTCLGSRSRQSRILRHLPPRRLTHERRG